MCIIELNSNDFFGQGLKFFFLGIGEKGCTTSIQTNSAILVTDISHLSLKILNILDKELNLDI